MHNSLQTFLSKLFPLSRLRQHVLLGHPAPPLPSQLYTPFLQTSPRLEPAPQFWSLKFLNQGHTQINDHLD